MIAFLGLSIPPVVVSTVTVPESWWPFFRVMVMLNATPEMRTQVPPSFVPDGESLNEIPI
jgi:hypothetical protein